MNGYDAFLQRLTKYRQMLGATQKEMSRMLNITQSQYSKFEQGRVIISYNVLKELKNHHWDIDFIITGRTFPRENNELNELYSLSDEINKCRICELFHWNIKNSGGINETPELAFEWNYLRMIVLMENNIVHPFEIVRKIYDITQIEMSEILGINIKKYREIEKREAMPDAQILYVMYEKLKCMPSVLTEDRSIMGAILNDIWGTFDEERKSRVMRFIKYGMESI